VSANVRDDPDQPLSDGRYSRPARHTSPSRPVSLFCAGTCLLSSTCAAAIHPMETDDPIDEFLTQPPHPSPPAQQPSLSPHASWGYTASLPNLLHPPPLSPPPSLPPSAWGGRHINTPLARGRATTQERMLAQVGGAARAHRFHGGCGRGMRPRRPTAARRRQAAWRQRRAARRRLAPRRGRAPRHLRAPMPRRAPRQLWALRGRARLVTAAVGVRGVGSRGAGWSLCYARMRPHPRLC